MIKNRLGDIEYDERGAGPTLVFAPGSCSTGAAWRPIIGHLGGNFRCVTTSLLGYGATAERRTVDDVDMRHEAQTLEEVIAFARAPVHLIGHSFGSLVALALALRKRAPILSLSIIEAPAPTVLEESGELECYRVFREMSDAYVAAFNGGDREAIKSMIDFYGGPGTFDAWPERARAYAIETTPVNLLDWRTAFEFPLSQTSLATVSAPTLVLCGGASNSAVRRGNELLAAGIPQASFSSVPDAAHFMIATHPLEVAEMIAEHIAGIGK